MGIALSGLSGLSGIVSGGSSYVYSVAAAGRNSYTLPGTMGGGCAAVVNGIVYKIAGYNGAANIQTVQAYDPATDVWTSKANKTTAVRGAGCCVVGTKIHVLCGFTSVPANIHEVYDTVNNTWETKTAPGHSVSGVTCFYLNGLIYIVGGTNSGSFAGGVATVKSYDPTNDAGGWTTRASLGTARSTHFGGVLNGKIYISGGQNTAGSYLTSTEMYDPDLNTWTGKAACGYGGQHAGGAVANGYLYQIGGFNGAGRVSAVERYDPNANSWTAVASMPSATWTSAGCADSSSGVIYRVGGNTGSYVDMFDGFIDYQGSVLAAPFTGAGSGGDSITNITAATSGASVAFTAADRLAYRVNAWNTAAAAKTNTLIGS
jgi:hypothetical protein